MRPPAPHTPRPLQMASTTGGGPHAAWLASPPKLHGMTSTSDAKFRSLQSKYKGFLLIFCDGSKMCVLITQHKINMKALRLHF